MNCFRSFTYWPLSQSLTFLNFSYWSCELLSFFHLLTFVTVTKAVYDSLAIVVNCFRSFTYWPLSQFGWLATHDSKGCELLSFFHLLTFVTVIRLDNQHRHALWIAFVLSLIDLCHSGRWKANKGSEVVNCFRSFTYWPLSQCLPESCWNLWVVNCFRSFTYWPLSQCRYRPQETEYSCELLSFFHLLTFVTVIDGGRIFRIWLWIAFVLSLIDLCHSFRASVLDLCKLWIAFVLSLIDLCHSNQVCLWGGI